MNGWPHTNAINRLSWKLWGGYFMKAAITSMMVNTTIMIS